MDLVSAWTPPLELPPRVTKLSDRLWVKDQFIEMEQNLPDSFELNLKNDAAQSVFAWTSSSVWL